MPITLYDAFVPSCRQIVGSVQALIEKAEAHCADTGCAADEIAGASLHPTMLPLGFQVRSVAQHSHGAIEGVRRGRFSPLEGPDSPTDFAGMKALLATAADGLAAVDPDELEGFLGRDMLFEMREMKLPFTAEGFLLSFSQPNFYFHASTAYDILRAKGVTLGKRDFLGNLRMKT
jgi:uncharacterized protein